MAQPYLEFQTKTIFLMDPKWYAVYTRPRWEKKVAENLSARGIVNYCPLNRVTRQWSDRKKIVYVPLFASYVFVNVKEKQHHEVRECDGIINLLHWLGKPAVIKDYEIETVRKFLNEYSNVQIEKYKFYLNDNVRITNGPLMEKEGMIVMVKNNTVKVKFPSLGYFMYAELDKSCVQVLPSKPLEETSRYARN